MGPEIEMREDLTLGAFEVRVVPEHVFVEDLFQLAVVLAEEAAEQLAHADESAPALPTANEHAHQLFPPLEHSVIRLFLPETPILSEQTYFQFVLDISEILLDHAF